MREEKLWEEGYRQWEKLWEEGCKQWGQSVQRSCGGDEFGEFETQQGG